MLNKSHYQIGTDPVTGHQIVQKITHVSLDDVYLRQNADTGILEITERPKVTEQPRRLRFENEGSLRRVYAASSFKGVREGARGGLVSREVRIADFGTSWIWGNSTVTGDWDISGDVQICDSKLEGSGSLAGDVKIFDCVSAPGTYLGVSGGVRLTDVRIEGSGTVTIGGGADISNSTLHARHADLSIHRADLSITGGRFERGDIHQPHEVLSYPTRWGWMSAFRDVDGLLKVHVGCQKLGDWDDVRDLSSSYDASAVEKAMLEHFIAMVTAAQRYWTPPPAPAKSEPVEAGDFRSLAASAREAAQKLTTGEGSADNEPVRVNPFA